MNELFLGKDYQESLGFMELRLMGSLFPANANKYSKYVPAPFRTANVNQTNYQCKIEEPVEWPSAFLSALAIHTDTISETKINSNEFFPPWQLFYLLKISCLYTNIQAKTDDKRQNTGNSKHVKNARNETSQCLLFHINRFLDVDVP